MIELSEMMMERKFERVRDGPETFVPFVSIRARPTLSTCGQPEVLELCR